MNRIWIVVEASKWFCGLYVMFKEMITGTEKGVTQKIEEYENENSSDT